ncbi:DNA-cytosine methyltransferase [Novosphingobium resinovorum]|uniref:Cytosine-specific methyltransferase n=1 Tax=Novosphingobium resinovorum TaxID=158500 RepID=A0A031J409_9SPHN|nr:MULTISPECIES: DNA (cytosine-5-)-methyltransferase [Novosphingobium]EZP68017.1 DNA-cytosine methyltransferase [Novosphingobium resinovorum]
MRTADLFAGCGGMSAGSREAGMELAFAAEKWEAAAATYERNLGHDVERLDLEDVVSTVRKVRAARADVIMGGPPCQDFSQAGSRVEAGRARLTVAFAETIRAARPKWFVMENVPEAQGSRSWAIARGILRDAGYGISEAKLNAAFHGVPQSRKRYFAVGKLEAEDAFLEHRLEGGRTAEPLTIRSFLQAEHDDTGEDERSEGHFDVDFYYRHPRNWGRRAIFSLDEPSPTVRSTNRPVAPGYKQHPDDPAAPEQVRALTQNERARIQTFPRHHSFEGTRTDIDMMVANAVPCRLAAHVAATIMEYEMSATESPEDLFRAWLRTCHEYTPRAAGDVLSRLRRVNRLIGDGENAVPTAEDAIRRLRDRQEFAEMTKSVRSQIKRAIELHNEFAAGGDLGG